jgi:hypothetical protein
VTGIIKKRICETFVDDYSVLMKLYEVTIPFQSFFFGFLGLRERDFALHRGQMGALRWIC